MLATSDSSAIEALAPFVEQYEYECLLSSRNAAVQKVAPQSGPVPEPTLVCICVPPACTDAADDLVFVLALQSVRFSLDSSPFPNDPLALHGSQLGHPKQQSPPKYRSSTPLPAFYSANHAVTKLAQIQPLTKAFDWIRDMPVQAQGPLVPGTESLPTVSAGLLPLVVRTASLNYGPCQQCSESPVKACILTCS